MSFWSVITGTEDQAAQDARFNATKQLAQERLNNRIAEGSITQDRADEFQSYLSDAHLEDTDKAAAQGFQEGLQEGLSNIGNTAKGFLDIIPVKAWIAIAVVGAAVFFFYFGGLGLLRKRS